MESNKSKSGEQYKGLGIKDLKKMLAPIEIEIARLRSEYVGKTEQEKLNRLLEASVRLNEQIAKL